MFVGEAEIQTAVVQILLHSSYSCFCLLAEQIPLCCCSCVCVFVSDCIARPNEGVKSLKKSDQFWHIAERHFFSLHVTSVGMFVQFIISCLVFVM